MVGVGLPSGLEPKSFELVWFDEFTDFDLSRDGRGEHKWFNGLWYSRPAPLDRFSISDGALRLSTHQKQGAVITTLSPRVDGADTTFRHGYFEARLAMSANSASWPAFWLFSKEHARGTDGRHWCEIDIFELFANKYGGTIHDWNNGRNNQNQNNLAAFPAGTDLSTWHTYGLLWEPGKVTWFFDKHPLMSAASPTVCDTQNLFLILNASTRDPSIDQYLLVDWVAVHRLKP